MLDKKTVPLFQWRWLHPRYALTWLGVGLLALLAFIPWQARWWLGQKIGSILYQYQHKRRAIIQTNLRLCFKELDQTTRDRMTCLHLQHYAAALLDYGVLFFRSRATISQRIKLTLPKEFKQAQQNHRPIILLLGHSTWLEFAPLALGLEYPAYGSYKPFSNPISDWLITRSRLKDVDFVIAREDGLLRLVRALTPERLLIFLPDEDLGNNASVFVPFMGQTKATLTTPARIAQITQAICFPTMAFFDTSTGQYDIRVGSPLIPYPSHSSEADAELMNSALEQLIHLHPTQYMWLMKLFKTQPHGENWYQ